MARETNGYGTFAPATDKKGAIESLWKQGILYWKLNKVQKIMYDKFAEGKQKLS